MLSLEPMSPEKAMAIMIPAAVIVLPLWAKPRWMLSELLIPERRYSWMRARRKISSFKKIKIKKKQK